MENKEALNIKQELERIQNIPDDQTKLLELEKCIAKYPDTAEAYFELGKIYRKTGELQKAKKSYQTFIALDSDNADGYFNLAYLLTNDFFKEFEQAKRYYEKAIELNGKKSHYFFHLANLLSNDFFKEYESASKYYEESIKLNYNDAIVYDYLAFILYEYLNKPDKAKEYLEEGLKKDTNSAYLHYNYAELLFKHSGETEKAKYHFSRAIELKKDELILDSARDQLRKLTGNETSFISKIYINRILHLKDIVIESDSKQLKHLIITGHNGCGKTLLINRIRDYLQKLIHCEPDIAILDDFEKKLDIENPNLISIQPNHKTLYYKFRSGFFIIAHFDARRNLKLPGIQNIENIRLPVYANITVSGDTNYTNKNFLKYAVNQYNQWGFAVRKKDTKRQTEIERWIANFENIVRTIDDRIEKVELVEQPDYHFEFIPKAPYERFTFEQLADGFASIFSIVAELILRMANKTLTSYDIEGLVLLDEPEAHLHLDLQKKVLPMLTKLFPRVQFIVTTHSPFILSSLENAVVYDLEKKNRVENVSKYSYWGLAEGYFDVNQYSQSALKKLDEYERLVEKYLSSQEMDNYEKNQMEKLRIEFENMPAFFAKELSIKFNQIELKRLNHD